MHFKEKESCWQCGHASAQSLFCQYCDSLQPPTPDYFRFFDIEPKLDVDRAALEKRFYELSRKLHPDLYTIRPATERQYSLDSSVPDRGGVSGGIR